MYILGGESRMQIREIKNEIEEMLKEKLNYALCSFKV